MFKLAAFRSEILEIKQAFSHDHASSSKQTLSRKTFQRNQNALSIERTYDFQCYKVTF